MTNINAKNLLLACLVLMSSVATAQTCDASLLSSEKLDVAKYRFRFLVEVSNCQFKICPVYVYYRVSYVEKNSEKLKEHHDIAGFGLRDGKHKVIDEKHIGDPRYIRRVENLEITEVSCP